MNWGNCVIGGPNGVATLQCIPAVFTNIITVLFMFTGTVTAIFLILSAYRFIFSGGDAKQIDSAKKTMLMAILGLLLIFFSYLILSIIAKVTGVTCILNFGPGSCK